MTTHDHTTPFAPPPTRCLAVDEGGYRCELPWNHAGSHRAIIGASDWQGTIPERTWPATAASPGGCKPPAPSPPAAAPTQPPKDTQRLDWLEEMGVETIYLRDGRQITPGGLGIRAAIDLNYTEDLHDAL